jgi:hypothetical protein
MILLSPTLCRSVLDERFIWIAFGTSGWSKALGRNALSIGRLTPIPDLGACVVRGSRLCSALRCGGVRVWAVSLLWCHPIPLAVSSARRICCRSRALCTPARMSSRTRLRLSSRVLSSVAVLELACGESAGTTPNIAIPLLSHSCMTRAQVDQMNVPCVRASSSLSYLLKCPDASRMIATACLPAFTCRIQ